MRTSQFLLSTLKETPTDAEIISHQLMLRAGLIRKVAAGIYNWLPLGLRVLKKVEQIVREEMTFAGAQEVLMPAIQPAQLWQQSGRWDLYGAELLRLKDRHQREFCIGPTHEEVISALMANEIRSYKQLPLNFYQIQTKFRDERRPRFGVMRSREFIMKDAYSFHNNHESLEKTYEKMYQAYHTIFNRLGLDFRAVEADTGSIGGNTSHEFQVLAESGEDAIAICDKHQYAANVELAEALQVGNERQQASQDLCQVDTPNKRTISELVSFLNIPIESTVKTLLVKGADHDAVALVLRGDHELNEVKAEKHPLVASPLTWLDDSQVENLLNCQTGSIGVVNLELPIIADYSSANLTDFICGANQTDVHYVGVNWGRDCDEPETFDLRTVIEGDICSRAKNSSNYSTDDQITIKRGIEVGHIFQLGDKYSQAMNATCLDKNGKAVAMQMGCYGIGITRIIGAAIEQNHDDKGIIWPDSIAPFQIVITPIGYDKSEKVKQVCDEIYQQLIDAGVEVLLDDRNERPGIKFADADLIGIPHRIIIGEKSLEKGEIEYKGRTSSEPEYVTIENSILSITQWLIQKMGSNH